MAIRCGRRLERKVRRHRGLIEHAAVGIFDTSPDGRYRAVNPALVRIFGFQTGAALRRTVPRFPHRLYVHPERRAALLRLLNARDAVKDFESEVRREDGRVIWVRESVCILRDTDGRRVGFTGTVEDITRLIEAEAERNQLRSDLQKACEQLEITVEKRTRELAAANAILRAEIHERRQAEQELALAHGDLAAAETEKKHFYREVIRCVTRGKFHLVEPEEIDDPGELMAEFALETSADEPPFRREVRRLAASVGMSPVSIDDLELAVGEAATNAIKHAVSGWGAVYRGPEYLVIRVTDRGAGIRAGDLPATILMPGFSGADSLGMGYTLMLALIDRIWLATDHNGTIVQLEKCIENGPTAPTDKVTHLLSAWDRL